MTPLHELAQLGQALWYDYIRRAFIASGDLQTLIDQGLRGVTSNPTIFEKAIVGSADYDEDLRRLVEAGTSVDDMYEALVTGDVGRAADLFRPVYQYTNGLDGYVSLEVSPQLAHDTAGTIAEARRLFAVLGRPNVMIKVPATPEGIPAVETLIGEGINVNVTLIFALARYQAVAEAYLAGLEKLAAKGGDLTRVASVASFFVSRIDTAVDRVLEKMGQTELQGKAAVANAKQAYAHFRDISRGARWERLASLRARVQRPLWASTGTKNPHYPDTLYVDSLIGPDTVNTVPPATLQAFLDHGTVASTLEVGLEEARAHLARLAELGVDLDAITKQLEDEGVTAFAASFETLLGSIATKRDRLQASHKAYQASLGAHQAAVDAGLASLSANNTMNRIWAHDYTVWKPQPTEITNRLGWLQCPEIMPEHVHAITNVVDAVRADGYTHALLLGMGGSSLAPEVFRRTFGVKEGYLDLAVLDSTDPHAVLAHAERLDMTRTLFIVSTKSGRTTETISFFKFFYNRVVDAVGAKRAGQHFIAITDPGSPLVATAKTYDFRATFLNDPNIGGRYSALSYFGLVPAALLGVDVPRLLDRAYTMACNSEGCNNPVEGNNASAWLGTVIGELAITGRDKVTLVTSPPIAAFGAWVEQLIAESTGKQGEGIVPVTDEPLGPPTAYGSDRLFVYLRLQGEETHDDAVHALVNAGQPVVSLHLLDRYDLGGEFFRWEMATALAGQRIGINPFDQPNVEAAKVLARQMVAAYQKDGSLPRLAPTLEAEGIVVYADGAATSLEEVLHRFLAQARPGDYIALQAYIQPTEQTDAKLQQLRTQLRDRLQLATTVGYGPRFLHSTGQLHKGDAGKGLFLQLTDTSPQDAPIPDEPGSPTSSLTFGVLKMAQALGDRQALLEARPRRRIITFHLDQDGAGGLEKLREALS